MMAVPAQMRPFAPPIYHHPSPQPTSPVPAAATPNYDPHGRSLYTLSSPTASPFYGYHPYSDSIQLSPYASHTTTTQHHPLTSPSFMVQPLKIPRHNPYVSPPILHSTPASKLHALDRKLSAATPKHSTKTTASNGPIKATTPTKHRDANGVDWVEFEYSRDRIKTEYAIRCDITSVNLEELDENYKKDNCIYPRAFSNDHYRGNRLKYETECNEIGWALTALNAPLRGKRGLIQRAVDSWRNSFNFKSRRVRRIDKTNRRREMGHAQDIAPGILPSSYVSDGMDLFFTA